MTLMKAPLLPNLLSDKWLSDFFDNDRFFDADWMKRMQVMPAVNIKELDKSFEIEMAVPGMEKKDFQIKVENGMLEISSEKKEEKEEKENNYTRKEFNYTSFHRAFNLPENINEEKIDAQYLNGILKINIGKKILKEEKFHKKIEVK
ncbi:MAG TPA: Hsp20/alpha crystallin family protein [Cyclobacteriaceae bacterium]|nr:Hsp20/alpha crystallin family protein [Cyclobacteriaceae bacterium]